MNVLFVVSGAVGHIDFGGRGFVRLDEQFRANGHDTCWFSFGEQVKRLRSLGCIAADVPEVARINLLPINGPEEIERFATLQERRIDALRRFLRQVEEHRPDLMVIDRLVVGAGLVADQLDIPYISVGTPGGHWRFDVDDELGHVNVHPAAGPVESYRAYGEILKSALGWSRGELDSGWLRSPYCNVHFMGASFYSDISDRCTASIFHHHSPPSRGTRIAISFGNQGSTGRLMQLAERLVDEVSQRAGVSIFAGANTEIRNHFTEQFPARDVRAYAWVDFAGVMPDLACLVFLGGIGSIWHCVDQRIPTIVSPGHIGDQLENARRVDSVGIGLHLDETVPTEAVPALVERIVSEQTFDHGISVFRSQANYSDTIESFIERASRLDF